MGPKGDSGLRVAWASSIQDGNRYPWLAIDLIRPHSVKKVEIVNRKGYEKRTKDIEARVGDKKPFERHTNGDTLYTFNTVCGVFAGPANTGDNSEIECSPPI